MTRPTAPTSAAMRGGLHGRRAGDARGRSTRARAGLLVLPLLVLALTPPAIAQRSFVRPTLHEPIPPDPREDVALSVSFDGDLPAAIDTPRGLVSAPDPTRPIGAGDAPYSASPRDDAPGSTFRPDRITTRPDALPYDEPFSPSTAPFKRLAAYDSVDANYTLSVRDPHATPLAVTAVPPPAASEEHFYADMVVDLAAGQKVRIPSVGAGARVLRARAGIQAQDVRFTLYKDGAENWFIEGDVTTRARLVMELSAPRAAFGGDFGNPTRAELRAVPPLPPNVQAAAAQVAQKIGVTPRSAPREVVTKLVSYFRAFQESEEPPTGRGDIYLDLALQQKGVCRHRSFAFLVTALYLGIPTRMISNEAHAWVEVNDGQHWRRIDLGGAGRTLTDPLSANVPYEPPPDPFRWPQGAARGGDLAERARRAAAGGAASSTSPTTASSNDAPPPALGSRQVDTNDANDANNANDKFDDTRGGTSTTPEPVTRLGPDARPPSNVTMTLDGTEARRGAPLSVRGQVISDGEPCGHVAVEIVLRDRSRVDIPIGILATDERGSYAGALVLPPHVPLGDYEAHARTLGDGRCGRGQTK